MIAQKCPVCEGRGTVHEGFYDQAPSCTAIIRPTCRSCGGRGMVFVPGGAEPLRIVPPQWDYTISAS